ncbi:MAG: hypothetical protein V3T05_08215 [Myxococcota bacterium]
MSTRLPILLRSPSKTQRLPTVTALEAVWDDVNRKPLWAPPNHWRYLALRWRMRLGLVRPERTKVIAPSGKVNDCAGCNDICCVGPHSTVMLRLRDIATLIDIDRTDLIVTEKPTFSQAELEARPALRRTTASDAWRIFPVLRQNRYHACAALTADGLCSLYPHWPMSCARFPYSYHADDDEIFYSQRCDSYWVRPDTRANADSMARLAVEGYNERIKDMVLIAYARDRLEETGLARYLNLS